MKNKKGIGENLIKILILIVVCFVVGFALIKYLLPAIGINLFG